MADIVRTLFQSAEEFLHYIRLSNPKWWDPDEQQTRFFRGHANAEWLLLPSAHRPITKESPLHPLIERARIKSQYFEPNSTEQERSTAWLHDAINDMCALFVKSAERSGIQLPEDSGQQRAVAQHHGLPTALLDFTTNPLVAAFFAAEAVERENSTELCVWVIEPNQAREPNFYNHLFPIALPLIEGNPYMRAQSGLFVQHMSWRDHRPYKFFPAMSLQDFQRMVQLPFLEQITLPAAEAPQLLRLLRREGISEAQLKPSLDNVARDVRLVTSWMS